MFGGVHGKYGMVRPSFLSCFHLSASPSHDLSSILFISFPISRCLAYFDESWDPWRAMLAKDLSTWEDDSIDQRS